MLLLMSQINCSMNYIKFIKKTIDALHYKCQYEVIYLQFVHSNVYWPKIIFNDHMVRKANEAQKLIELKICYMFISLLFLYNTTIYKFLKILVLPTFHIAAGSTFKRVIILYNSIFSVYKRYCLSS